MTTKLTEETLSHSEVKDSFSEIVYNNIYAFYLTQWVEYHNEAHASWRLKMPHEIKLKDGSEHIKCWPNANSWACSTGRFNDDDVEFIRLSSVHPLDDARK